MPRIRNIKPEFFRHEGLAELPFEVRLGFIGLWTLADRCGRLEDRPKRIKIEIFPYDDVKIETVLSSLEEKRYILRYSADGLALIQILNFEKHQRVSGKERAEPTKYPPPGSNGEALGKENSFPVGLGYGGRGTEVRRTDIRSTEGGIPPRAEQTALPLATPTLVSPKTKPENKSSGDVKTPLKLARELMDSLGVPGGRSEVELWSQAILLKARTAGSLQAAYEHIYAKASEAKTRGEFGKPSFWIRDASYDQDAATGVPKSRAQRVGDDYRRRRGLTTAATA